MAPVTAPPISDGAVVVDGNRIVAVGTARELAAAYPAAQELDLGSAVLCPGFIDSHCHVEWSLSPSGGPCRDGFAAWLTRIMARGKAMQPDDFVVAARFGVARALLAGTTLILDAGPTGAGAQAARTCGLRAHVHLEAFGRLDAEQAQEMTAGFAPRVAALDGGLVTAGVSPHAPYTVSPDLWRALASHPQLAARPWMTHVAESDQELPAISAGEGPLGDFFRAAGSTAAHWPGTGSEIARLHQGGVLRSGLVAAHCVQMQDGDAELLAATGVGVAHCPVSNANLGVGTHPLAITRGAGVNVGFGSDSPATDGTYDVRAVARASALTDPRDRLHLATVGGAQVAGRAHELGSLVPGHLADLTVVAVPAKCADPLEAMWDEPAAVTFVMVDGRIVVKDGDLQTDNMNAIVAEAEAVRRRVAI